MTKRDLLAMLAPYPDDAVVLVYNALAEAPLPVTGCIYLGTLDLDVSDLDMVPGEVFGEPGEVWENESPVATIELRADEIISIA